jgi:hypothetical protein
VESNFTGLSTRVVCRVMRSSALTLHESHANAWALLPSRSEALQKLCMFCIAPYICPTDAVGHFVTPCVRLPICRNFLR